MVKPSRSQQATMTTPSPNATVENIQHQICDILVAVTPLFYFELSSRNVSKVTGNHAFWMPVAKAFKAIMKELFRLCCMMNIDLTTAMFLQMRINRFQYNENLRISASPVPSAQTHATTSCPLVRASNNDIPLRIRRGTRLEHSMEAIEDTFDKHHSLLTREVVDFATTRNWLEKYTSMSICMSLTAQVGALATIVQWSPGATLLQHMNDQVLDKLARAAANIAICLLHYERITFLDNT